VIFRTVSLALWSASDQNSSNLKCFVDPPLVFARLVLCLHANTERFLEIVDSFCAGLERPVAQSNRLLLRLTTGRMSPSPRGDHSWRCAYSSTFSGITMGHFANQRP
jgi:hypothetical protein